jgi:hypothetical protein
MKSYQNNPSGNFSFHNAQQPASKPNAPHLPATKNDRCCYNCAQLGHYSNNCTRPRQQNQGKGSKFGNPDRKQNVQVKQGRLNFTTVDDLPAGAPILTGIFSI